MGFAMSWIAVRGRDRDDILQELGLARETEVTDFPPTGMSVSPLAGGWLLFLADRDLDAAFEPRFTDLSRGGSAVACAIEEHVMFQEARGYRDGTEVWRVTHDCDKEGGLYHLEVTGDPPNELEAIRREAIANQDAEGGQQADVDFLADVPLDLAKAICGFKHDDEWPEGMGFSKLFRPRATSSPRTSAPGLLQRLFGRR
jgi:hypothetical protein